MPAATYFRATHRQARRHDNATKKLVLCHVFEITPKLIKHEPVEALD
ncbi:MAG: hypothetical protein J7M29_01675 [Verrucomicrobia bacterium]|nr:hypothetical protein [Verrucomicrobiota bacterium]